mgnify:CR=1 FL=1
MFSMLGKLNLMFNPLGHDAIVTRGCFVERVLLLLSSRIQLCTKRP